MPFGLYTKMLNNIQPPLCSACQTPMVLRVKGNDKFWGCPNYKECGGKTVPYYISRKSSFQKPPDNQGIELIMEEIVGTNERLDKLIAYLVTKLGKPE